ncbi:hypothetical protein BJX64DRAFT_291427 [Aspergillus heterothallicus]
MGVAHGYLPVVRLLLSNSAYPDRHHTGSLNRENPLLNAIVEQHDEITSLLLEHGAEPDIYDQDDQLLSHAMRSPKTFMQLLDKNAACNDTLHELDLCQYAERAALDGIATTLEYLMDKGADFCRPKFSKALLALPQIISRSNQAVLDVFIKRGYIPQFGVDIDGDFDLLLCAAKHPNIPLLRHLIPRGFNLHAMKHWPAAIISSAVSCGAEDKATEVLDFLVREQGLDIDSLNERGETALVSILSNRSDLISPGWLALLGKGANPFFQSSDELCPIVAVLNSQSGSNFWVQRVLDEIILQKWSFEVAGPQLLEAIGILEDWESDSDALRIIRQCYWRLKYQVD